MKWLATILLLFSIPWLYRAADGTGWVTHSQDSSAFIDGAWMVGEYRICGTKTGPDLDCSKDRLDVLAHSYQDSTIYGLGSDNIHVFPVSFRGPISRPGVKFWRCQRKESSLACSVLD